MNRQFLLLPVLIGLLQFTGWRTLPAQQPVEMVEKQASSTETDKEDQDGDDDNKQQKSEHLRSGAQTKEEPRNDGVAEKEVNQPSPRGNDEQKAGRTNSRE